MRIAVLGSTGMAGHVISLYLEEKGHDVYRVSRSEKSSEKSAAIDAADFRVLGAYLEDVKPNAVINCIGLLQRACEDAPDQAVLINAYLPHWLERRYRDSKTQVIHLSTDCVFSGDKGGYREDDIPNGTTMYDRSKALGELQNEKDLTFRMSIIGPDIDPSGTGLFNWLMAQTGAIHGWTRALWNGVTTVTLAHGIDAALQTGLSGLYQLVTPVPIDKCSLLGLICTVFDRQQVSVTPDDRFAVNKSLVNTRTDFGFLVPDYPEQLAEMKRWTDAHASQYPHYYA